MGVLTSRAGLYKAGGGLSGLNGVDETADIDAAVNANLDKLDLLLGLRALTSTTRPAAPMDGQVIYETDTRNQMYWSVAGVRWVPIGTPNAASDALRTALYPAPVQGNSVFRTDKAWNESYYDLFNVATNPGGAAVAGWYPVAGSMPGANLVRSATANLFTAGAYNLLTASAFSETLAGSNRPHGFTTAFSVNNGFTIPFSGMWDVWSLLVTSTAGNFLMLIKKNSVALSDAGLIAAQGVASSSSVGWGTVTGRIPLVAGDVLRLFVLPSVAMTIGVATTDANFGCRYVGPNRA